MTWMLQVGQNKGTECNEMRNFSLNAIVVKTGRVTRVKHNKEQTALKNYGNHLPHPTARCFFLWHPLEFNLFNRYRKYQNRIGSLLTSIGINIEAKIQYRPNLTQSHCCVEFETEITMLPRHFNPYYGFITPLNSSSFYPSYHFSLYFSSNFTFLMFVNICQRAPHTSPICWLRK